MVCLFKRMAAFVERDINVVSLYEINKPCLMFTHMYRKHTGIRLKFRENVEYHVHELMRSQTNRHNYNINDNNVETSSD